MEMRPGNLIKAFVLAGVCAAPVVYWAPWNLVAQEAPAKPLGGDLVPVRTVADPYPVFNGVAVDPDNNLVVMTDVNRKTVTAYDRNRASTNPADLTPPLR